MRRIIPLLFILFLENFALGYQVPIPVLIKPDNNSVIEETSPKFDWYLIEKNAYKYLITIYEDDNSSKRKIVLRTDVLRPPWNIPAGYLENGKTYYWIVVAKFWNVSSKPSELWNFKIKPKDTDAKNIILGKSIVSPILVIPVKNSIIREPNKISFDWFEEEGIDSYSIAIYSDVKCTQKIIRASGVKPPWKISVTSSDCLENGKTYYWRVVAEKGNTYSSPSEVWSFTINEEKESQSSGTNEKICPNCQKEIEPGSKYCGYCGSKLTGVVKKSNSVEQIKTEYKESYQSRPEPEPVKEIPYTSKSKTIKDITWIEGGLLVLAILLCL